MRKKPWRRFPVAQLLAQKSSSLPSDLPTDRDVVQTAPQQPVRAMNMNAYGSQPSRPAPRLQNTQKTAGLGNVLGGGGWGMGLPAASGASSSSSAFGPPSSTQPRVSGFAQIMGGGQGPIDMSEFPTLSGGPRAATNSNQGGVNWNSSAVRAQPSAPQAQQQAQQSQRAPSTAPSQHSLDQFDNQRTSTTHDRTSGGEEFPPLGGHVNGDAQQNFSTFAASPDSAIPRTSGPPTQLPIREPGSFSSSQQAPIGSGGLPHQHSQQSQTSQNIMQSSSAPSSGMKKYADMTEGEKYGMLGLEALLNARRNIEAGLPHDTTLPASELNGVLMGQDVSTLGMDLESSDPILPTFTPFPAQVGSGSQFNYHDQFTVPEYTLPSAYTVTNVPQISSRISAMSDETLFMMFFLSPGDTDQELAAMELSAREWRWHKILRQWLQKDTPANLTQASAIVDLATNTPIGSQPVRVAERVERGVYVFFDPTNWRRERREFTLDYDQLDFRSGVQQPATGPGMNGGNAAQQGNAVGIPPGMMGGGIGAVGGSVGGAVGSGHGGSSQIQGS